MNNYHLLNFVKKILVTLIAVYIGMSGKTQLILLILLHCASCLFNIAVRAYKNIIIQIIRITTDILLVALFSLLYYSHMFFKENIEKNLDDETNIMRFLDQGWYSIALLLIFNMSFLLIFLVNLACLLYELVKDLMHKGSTDADA